MAPLFLSHIISIQPKYGYDSSFLFVHVSSVLKIRSSLCRLCIRIEIPADRVGNNNIPIDRWHWIAVVGLDWGGGGEDLQRRQDDTDLRRGTIIRPKVGALDNSSSGSVRARVWRWRLRPRVVELCPSKFVFSSENIIIIYTLLFASRLIDVPYIEIQW